MTSKIRLVLAVLVFYNFTIAQNQVNMINNSVSENIDMQNIIDFQNIYIDKLNFESKDWKRQLSRPCALK